jgi:hypothetical protein
MPDLRRDGDASDRPAEPAHPAHDHKHDDLPRDHHPADARTPEEYTERPGSHRKGRHGPATDVGA